MSVFRDIVRTVTGTAKKAGDESYDKNQLKHEAQQEAAEIALPEQVKNDPRFNQLQEGKSDAGVATSKSSDTGKVATAATKVSPEKSDQNVLDIIADAGKGAASFASDLFANFGNGAEAPEWAASSGITRDEYEELKENNRTQAQLDQDRQKIYEDLYSGLIQDDDLRMDANTLESAMQSDPRFQQLAEGRSDMGGTATTASQDDVSAGISGISFKDDDDKRQHLASKYGKDPSDITDEQVNSIESKVDDGSLERSNLTAPDMTGEQYIKFVEAGLGGRPVDDIDPNAVYNKIDEHDNYGFTYYSPDWQTELGMRVDHGIGMIPKAAAAFANLRPQNYMKTVEGVEFNSKDFADRFAKWSDTKLKEALDKADSEDGGMVLAGDADEETRANSVPMALDGITIVTEDGQEHQFDASSYYLVRQNPDGSIVIQLNDENATTVIFDDVDDYNENLRTGQMRIASDGEDPFAYLPIDGGLEVGGTYLTPRQAMKVRSGNFEADYGPFGIMKPREELEEFWDAERSGGNVLSLDNFDFTDAVPQFVDIALGSSPYFVPKVAWPLAVANAYEASKGIDTMTIDPQGRSYMVSENISPDVHNANVIGNAVMPATEYGLGNIGRQVVKPFSSMTHPLAPSMQLATGVVGEGLEEIPANLIDNIKLQGASDLYANKLTDEYGNVLLDSTGHPLYDQDTSFFDRARNFGMDAPNAFIGGAMLGGAFGLRELPSVVRNTKQALGARRINSSLRPQPIDPEDIEQKG